MVARSHPISQKDGVPTRVDLQLVKRRVKEPSVRAFFVRHPEILPAEPNLAKRERWAQLMVRRPYFSYKRDTGGVYKNDALNGKAAQRGEWLLELEPCVRNVLRVCEHFLGVDFAPCRAGDGGSTPQPWEGAAGEAHNADISHTATRYFDFALRSLSRPGMALRGHVNPPRNLPSFQQPRPMPRNKGYLSMGATAGTGARSLGDVSSVFYVDLDIAVNAQPAWRWELTRTVLTPCPRYHHLCAPARSDDDGWGEGNPEPRFMYTSKHSHIDFPPYSESMNGKWSWIGDVEAAATPPPSPPSLLSQPTTTTVGPAAWEALRQWTQAYPLERYRPPRLIDL